MNKELITYKIYNTCYELQQFQQELDENALSLEEYKDKDIAEIKERMSYLIGNLISIKDEDEVMVDALSEHIKALQDRKNRFERRIANIKKTILNAFEMSDTHKIIAPNGTISIVRRKTLKITDENALRGHHPEYFKVPAPKLDSKAVLKDLENGVLIEGVEVEKTKGLMFRK